MIKELISFVSLQAFLVSKRRKVWFVIQILLLAGIFALYDPYVADQGVVREFIRLLIVFLLASLVGTMLRFIIVTAYRRRINSSLGDRDNFILGIDAATSLVVAVVTIGSMFPLLDIPFVTVLTSLSLFSVAIAWLFKEYLSNFFDSFRLMFSKDFLIGDYIKIDDSTKGVITDITFRATKVKTDEGDVLFIPNTTLMNTAVTNFSKVKFKRIIIPFTLETTLLYDLADLEHHIADALLFGFPDLIRAEKVFLRIKEINTDKTHCALEVAIDQFNFSIENDIHKACYRAILVFQHRRATSAAG